MTRSMASGDLDDIGVGLRQGSILRPRQRRKLISVLVAAALGMPGTCEH